MSEKKNGWSNSVQAVAVVIAILAVVAVLWLALSEAGQAFQRGL